MSYFSDFDIQKQIDEEFIADYFDWVESCGNAYALEDEDRDMALSSNR